MDEDFVAVLERKFLEKHPNTYTLTKGLAEQIILRRCSELPAIAIVRPSIVCAAYREPFPGWVDNVSGTTGELQSLITSCLNLH